MPKIINFPPQQLPFSKKTKDWRKQVVDWADNKMFFNYGPVRQSILHKKINYDLLGGILHMNDVAGLLNPENIQAGFIPDQIQHYPTINSKLNVLRGEESKRVFDYRVIVTNPNAISEIENNKQEELITRLQQILSQKNLSEDAYNTQLEKLNDYYTYQWQDFREIRANALLSHYVKEYNIPFIFNQGFMDAMNVAEEIYLCDIVSGEPVIERINPLKIRVFKSGYSNKIEDADIIVLEDFWSPGKIVDTYYDALTNADIKYLENIGEFESGANDSTDNYDERKAFIPADFVVSTDDAYYLDPLSLFDNSTASLGRYYDSAGNIRVMRVFWKSRRKIKKVKSYDPQTGEEVYGFYPETYTLNQTMGEEEQIFWINEAWEGTMIGGQIYLNMRPRIVQYNRLSNPSRCHFGIIGSIYNLNDSKPFSLVDMMKPYSYFYDVIHDRLNKAVAANWGKIVKVDLALVPKKWDIEKWLYYAKVNHIAVVDSFKEGNIGQSTGKLAGALNTNTSGVIDAETGNYIQQHVNLLEFIKMEMAEVAGISKQREGQVSNRETVGGVERATLQSSHITEWLFVIHEDLKRRVLECFLETAKIALKGRTKKFSYLLSDSSQQIMEIDGDEFAEADYGLLVDNSISTQELSSKLEQLVPVALQRSSLSFSTIMKLYSSSSMAEKQRFIELDEQKIQERNAQQNQQELQTQQTIADQAAAVQVQKLKQKKR